MDWQYVLCNELKEVNETYGLTMNVCEEAFWPSDFKRDKRKREKTVEEIRDQRKQQVVEHVICPVCQALVEATNDRFKALGLDIGTEEALEKAEDDIDKMCMSMEPPGRWVTRFDFQRDCSDCPLEVIWNKDAPAGECTNECQVAVRACTKALKGHEEILKDMVLANKPIKEIQKAVCKKACKKKKLAPLEFWKDELFEERKQQDVEVQTLQRIMDQMPGVSTNIKTTPQYIAEKAEHEKIHQTMPHELREEEKAENDEDDDDDEADYSQRGEHEDL